MKHYYLVLVALIAFLFLVGCETESGKNNNATDISSSAYADELISQPEESQTQIKDSTLDKERYIQFDSTATFKITVNGDKVSFTDDVYSENEYNGKVSWVNAAHSGTVKTVSQIVTKNKEIVYEKELEIVDVSNETQNNHKWDYFTNIVGSITVNGTRDDKYECYIKFVDANDVEYHVMLLPIKGYNDEYILTNSGFCGSATYIIDEKNDIDFWYHEYF